ncbi:MAG: dUTP diphosphatase [Desulfovibrionaceae bacterium]
MTGPAPKGEPPMGLVPEASTPEASLSGAPTIDVKVRFLPCEGDPYGCGQGACDLAYGTPFSAGLDLRACLKAEEIVLQPGDRFPVPSGIAIEACAPGVAGFVFSRSGLGAKDGVTVSQGVGVIDPDYRGEIIVSLLNTSKECKTIRRGQRIAQLLFLPFFRANVIVADELSDTARGAGGFGHTGRM